MPRKTTDIDTPGKHAPRESQVMLQDGRVLYAQRWVRARRTVTAVPVVLGILVALGLAFWGAAAVGDLTLTSRLSQLQVRCPRLHSAAREAGSAMAAWSADPAACDS